VGGDARQVHAPGAVLDEEQDVQAAQKHRVDVKEVSRQDRVGLGGEERAPGLAAPIGWGPMSASLRIFQTVVRTSWPIVVPAGPKHR
jgi:hypothetical protein